MWLPVLLTVFPCRRHHGRGAGRCEWRGRTRQADNRDARRRDRTTRASGLASWRLSNIIGNLREHRMSIGSVKVFEHGTLERADFSRVSRIDRWWI